jgi:hypothetical protein
VTRQEAIDAAGVAFAKALRNLDRRRAEEAVKTAVQAITAVRADGTDQRDEQKAA